MSTSPPPSPSPQKKRKFADIDFGASILARPAKAQRNYYGIDIHRLLDDARIDVEMPKAVPVELPTPPAEQATTTKATTLWTEKYRARKFTDLLGDERTHRSVMHWLKRWDPIVFPGSVRPKPKTKLKDNGEPFEEKPHRKILMLTGPPGLGKTTLAHVCARQAGYEVQEINASDERSAAVVKGRIKDMAGTENVKGVDIKKVDGKVRKAGKPVCIIVDEVDGVVSGSGGGGEGGFVKALIDLVLLDQKNSTALGSLSQAPTKKKKGERFRLLRPMILICNDVYHPALRPLRQSAHAEVVHVRKPQIQAVASRMQAIFDKENVPCEGDGVRRLCEATWGVSNRKEDRTGNGAGEGDVRGIMVVGEWVATKLRSENINGPGDAKLTRRWVEDNVLQDLAHGGGAARGIGRGGPKDIVDRVFQEGAGFPKSTAISTPTDARNIGVQGVSEGLKRTATTRLRELVDTHGDTDRIMTDCFSTYPSHRFQDDTTMSKPSAAYDWLHFHDTLSSTVFRSNEWELAPYLSTSVLAFHHLFASPTRAQYSAPTTNAADAEEQPVQPFTGPGADWSAYEALKQNTSLLQTLHSSLSHDLSRAFSSPDTLATELSPYLLRMLAPAINPTIISGSSGSERGTASLRKASEQTLAQRAVNAMMATGVRFERTKVVSEDGDAGWQSAQWVYRMEPSIDVLGTYETGGNAMPAAEGKQRFATRMLLCQEVGKEETRRNEAARRARGGAALGAAVPVVVDVLAKTREAPARMAKRDFFGRVVVTPMCPQTEVQRKAEAREGKEGKVWVTFHEGFSNAVRKPVTLAEFMKDL